MDRAVSIADSTCEIAPEYGLWPKLVTIERSGDTEYRLDAHSGWPLAESGAAGNMKIHHGLGRPITVAIHKVVDGALTVQIIDETANKAWLTDCSTSKRKVLVSGPYALRKAL